MPPKSKASRVSRKIPTGAGAKSKRTKRSKVRAQRPPIERQRKGKSLQPLRTKPTESEILEMWVGFGATNKSKKATNKSKKATNKSKKATKSKKSTPKPKKATKSKKSTPKPKKASKAAKSTKSKATKSKKSKATKSKKSKATKKATR